MEKLFKFNILIEDKFLKESSAGEQDVFTYGVALRERNFLERADSVQRKFFWSVAVGCTPDECLQGVAAMFLQSSNALHSCNFDQGFVVGA